MFRPLCMRCAPFGSIEPDVLSKVQGMSCVLRDVCYFERCEHGIGEYMFTGFIIITVK